MQKKKIVMGAVSLGLVAAVGVGGTLAYLSAQTETVTNTFTVGKGYDDTDGQALKLDEAKWDANKKEVVPGEREEERNEYKNLLPGDVVKKDPTVYLKNGSVESYVFLMVDGSDELTGIEIKGEDVFTVDGWQTSYWKKVVDAKGNVLKSSSETTGDGIYVANSGSVIDRSNETTTPDEYFTLPNPIFESVTMNGKLESLPEADALLEKNNIKVQACAVQYSKSQMNSYTDALAALQEATEWTINLGQ